MRVTVLPLIGKKAAYSAYDVFLSNFKHLIVYLAFSHLGFWRDNFFLIVAYLFQQNGHDKKKKEKKKEKKKKKEKTLGEDLKYFIIVDDLLGRRRCRLYRY